MLESVGIFTHISASSEVEFHRSISWLSSVPELFVNLISSPLLCAFEKSKLPLVSFRSTGKSVSAASTMSWSIVMFFRYWKETFHQSSAWAGKGTSANEKSVTMNRIVLFFQRFYWICFGSLVIPVKLISVINQVNKEYPFKSRCMR